MMARAKHDDAAFPDDRRNIRQPAPSRFERHVFGIEPCDIGAEGAAVGRHPVADPAETDDAHPVSTQLLAAADIAVPAAGGGLGIGPAPARRRHVALVIEHRTVSSARRPRASLPQATTSTD